MREDMLTFQAIALRLGVKHSTFYFDKVSSLETSLPPFVNFGTSLTLTAFYYQRIFSLAPAVVLGKSFVIPPRTLKWTCSELGSQL